MKAYAEILGTALEIWQDKLKEKHLKTYKKLMRKIRNEESKIQTDPENVDDSYIDQLYFELRLLGDSFVARAGKDLAA